MEIAWSRRAEVREGLCEPVMRTEMAWNRFKQWKRSVASPLLIVPGVVRDGGVACQEIAIRFL